MNGIRLGILQTNHDKSTVVGDAFPELVKRVDSIDAIEPPGWTRSSFNSGVKQLNVRVNPV